MHLIALGLLMFLYRHPSLSISLSSLSDRLDIEVRFSSDESKTEVQSDDDVELSSNSEVGSELWVCRSDDRVFANDEDCVSDLSTMGVLIFALAQRLPARSCTGDAGSSGGISSSV